MKVKRGQVVFWKWDLFPYVRWAVCTSPKVKDRPGKVEVTHGYLVVPRHAMSKKEAAPVIEALHSLTQHESAARHALILGFIGKLKSIAPFMATKEWRK